MTMANKILTRDLDRLVDDNCCSNKIVCFDIFGLKVLLENLLNMIISIELSKKGHVIKVNLVLKAYVFNIIICIINR